MVDDQLVTVDAKAVRTGEVAENVTARGSGFGGVVDVVVHGFSRGTRQRRDTATDAP
jgi:hypothetical protein